MDLIKEVRRAIPEKDIVQLGELNRAGFSGNRPEEGASGKWMWRMLQQYPLYQIFVAEGTELSVLGYIGWRIHGGFCHPAAPLELDQIAVAPGYQDRGIGSMLIRETMPIMVEWIRKRNEYIERGVTCHVWFRDNNNRARATYAKFFTPVERGERFIHGKREVCYMIEKK